MRSLRRAAVALLALALFPACAAAAMPSAEDLARGLMAERHAEHVANVDVRLTAPVTAPAAARAARAQLANELGRFAALSVDRTTGTARTIARTDGYLSAPAQGAPADIALAWARAHAAAIGLAPGDLSGLELTRNYRSLDGVTHLVW